MWSEFNDIMNQPYFREDFKTVKIQADKALFADADYYPSPDDEVYKGSLAISFSLNYICNCFQFT